MTNAKPMSIAERKLFKEQVIREYKAKYIENHKKGPVTLLFEKFRKLAPLNIMLGIIASVLMIWINGWKTFFYLILSGVIWLTILTTVLSSLSETK